VPEALDGVGGLPLGVSPGETYDEGMRTFLPGDQLVLYTDGVTEAENATGEQFGVGRLDRELARCAGEAPDLLKAILAALEEFTGDRPAADDRTLLAVKIS
jgi:sigma-B regulation protein RsbU (phosphoserine phosphatase)